MIEIPYEYGLYDLPPYVLSNPYARKIYRLALKSIVEDLLALNFKPNQEYNTRYDRSKATKNLLLEIKLDNNVDFSEVENTLIEFVSSSIKSDRLCGYGLYSMVEYRRGPKSGIGLVLEGDYRIMEWEAGRGKPDNTTIEDTSGMRRARMIKVNFERGDAVADDELILLAEYFPNLNLLNS